MNHANKTEVEYQGSNQYHFHWLSGDDIPQSLVHNLDRASWALREQAPVKAHGMGGRSTLRGEIYGNVFDHHSVVYEFASGVRLYALCRTIAPDPIRHRVPVWHAFCWIAGIRKSAPWMADSTSGCAGGFPPHRSRPTRGYGVVRFPPAGPHA